MKLSHTTIIDRFMSRPVCEGQPGQQPSLPARKTGTKIRTRNTRTRIETRSTGTRA